LHLSDRFYSLLKPFAQWHTPEGIAFVATKTFSDEPYRVQGQDLLGEPFSFSAADILLGKMLPNVVALPRAVREWAATCGRASVDAYRVIVRGGVESKASHAAGSDYVIYRKREIAQLWWKANEKAILEGRWQDVQPGEDFDTPKYRALLTQFGVRQPDAKQRESTIPPQAPTSALPPAVAPIHPTVSSNQVAYYIGGGLAILALAAALIWRKVARGKSAPSARETGTV
jgi:hypothetical protein